MYPPSATFALWLFTAGVGCAENTVRQVSTPLIEYHRSGGMRGTDHRLTVTNDGQATLTRDGLTTNITIESDVMNRLRGTMREIEFDKLEPVDQPQRGGADMYEYAITYQGHTVRAKELSLPAAGLF